MGRGANRNFQERSGMIAFDITASAGNKSTASLVNKAADGQTLLIESIYAMAFNSGGVDSKLSLDGVTEATGSGGGWTMRSAGLSKKNLVTTVALPENKPEMYEQTGGGVGLVTKRVIFNVTNGLIVDMLGISGSLIIEAGRALLIQTETVNTYLRGTVHYRVI